MDNTLLKAAKKTCALFFTPSLHFGCTDNAVEADSPFGNDYVLSLGFLIVMAITIPMGVFNLDDNIWVQKAGFIALLCCMVIWTVQFFYTGLDPGRVPVYSGSHGGIGAVVSTVIFNYGFIITLPSWINERMDDVPVGRSIWASVFSATSMFLVLGFLGGMGISITGKQDFLSALNDPENNVFAASLVAAYVFPLAALLTGIPVYSIIIRCAPSPQLRRTPTLMTTPHQAAPLSLPVCALTEPARQPPGTTCWSSRYAASLRPMFSRCS